MRRVGERIRENFEEQEIKLKCGLEIHQQLDTSKLFCKCPSVLRKDKPDYVVERKLHAVAGETGEVDEAAKYEAGKGRKFIYEGYYDNTCLVELDEEPPEEINKEALKIALQIALLLNCEVIPYTQIMRKTVIDGSNVSGFQRTVLIARNGYVDTEWGKIKIEGVALEEDAARVVNRKKNEVVYRLDRLGIPLVEISTAPEIKNAAQAKEVALKIGEILRACKVKRGIGTIRQDVNLSVNVNGKQGSRVEIKGVQEPALIEKTILNEMSRQIKLIKQGKSVGEVRKALPDGNTEFLRPLPGAARMYPETDLPLLHISRDTIENAKKELPKLKSEIRKSLKNEGLNNELIKEILNEDKLKEFEELLKVYRKPDLIAKMLTIWQKEIRNKTGKNVEKKLSLDIMETILQALQQEKIREHEVKLIMEEIVLGKNVEDALNREKLENVEEEVMKIVKEKPGLSFNAYMGLIMSKFKGKISGKEAAEILRKFVSN